MAATGNSLAPASPPRWPAANGWSALGAVVVLGGFMLAYWIDPLRCAWCPPCLWHEWTGWYCPGCGMTRAAHEVAHGHILVALHLNLLLVLALPGLVLTGLLGRRTMATWSSKPAVWFWGLAVIVAFGICRNIPVVPFTWLAP